MFQMDRTLGTFAGIADSVTVHAVVFFISLSFILCTVGGLWSFQFGPSGCVAWERYEKKGIDACNGDSEAEMRIDRKNINAQGRLLTEWFQDEKTTQAEYCRSCLRAYAV